MSCIFKTISNNVRAIIYLVYMYHTCSFDNCIIVYEYKNLKVELLSIVDCSHSIQNDCRLYVIVVLYKL